MGSAIAYPRLEDAYRRLSEAGREYVDQALAGLGAVPDAEFVRRCQSAIYTSAVMDRHAPRQMSVAQYDLVVDAMYEEALVRHIAAGHDSRCHALPLYERAYNRNVADVGGTPPDYLACSCNHRFGTGTNHA